MSPDSGRQACGGHRPSDGQAIRILIVDDHPSIRQAMALALADTHDLVCCGLAASGAEALDLVAKERPTAVVMDVLLGDSDGLDLVRRLHAIRPEVGIVLFSMLDESIFAERALAAGALGYVMKTEPMSEVLDAVRAAARGDVCVSSAVRAKILGALRPMGRPFESHPPHPMTTLNDREVSVVLLLGQGQSIATIADNLALGTKTVEGIRRSATRKLGLESNLRLVKFALTCISGHDWTPSENAAPVADVAR